MKVAIIRMSTLARLRTWSPRDILADTGTLNMDVNRAAARVRLAQEFLKGKIRQRQDALARQQAMIDSGELKIVAETFTPHTPSAEEKQAMLIDAWDESDSAQAVADKLGMKVDTVRHAATRRRKEGVPLSSKHNAFPPATHTAMVTIARTAMPGAHFRDPVAFVALWQSCQSRAEVARITGLAANACSVRARQYRRMGVPLKRFKN